MKKYFTLLIGLTIGCALSMAESTDASYTIGIGDKTTFSYGEQLSQRDDPVTVTIYSQQDLLKKANEDAKFPDGTRTSDLGIGVINIDYRYEYKINIVVKNTIYNVRIYYSGPQGSSFRNITVENYSGNINASKNDGGAYNSDEPYLAVIDKLSSGTYSIYAKDYKGGFAGIKYDVDGEIVDMFTTRTISHGSDGKSYSEWKYEGYENGTHGLVGGVDDNGIIYVSNSLTPAGKDNGNGNIKFSINNSSNNYKCFLSCQNNSTIYIPVPAGSSGTISMTCTASEDKDMEKSGEIKNSDGTTTNYKFTNPARRFIVYKDDNPIKENGEDVKMYMKTTGSSFDFSAENISTYQGGNYIKLVSYYDTDLAEKYKNDKIDEYKDEIKVLTFKIILDNGSYFYYEPETDYDHQIGEGHKHSIFNYTQGTLNYTKEKYEYAYLTHPWSGTGNKPTLEGKDISNGEAPSSKTYTIWSFRDGDLVKYKNQFYGALQLTSNTDYTITAPTGYYITTSVRIHGYHNRDKNTDGQTQTEHSPTETYINHFNGGDFRNNLYDKTYLQFARDDKGKTNTFDFTVPASKTVNFNFMTYQFLGVIDAVLVPEDYVPKFENKVTYKKDENTTTLNENELSQSLKIGGTILYTPTNENEELWWYFTPTENPYEKYGYRGYLEETWEFPDVEDQEFQNITRTYSVRNYKFVNTIGNHNTDENYLKSIYPPSTETQNYIKPLAEGQPTTTLEIKEPGTYYFYIKNTENNFNSPLGIATFSALSGVEDVAVDQPADDVDTTAPVYNVYGQRVDSSYRGVVIQNGRKLFQR